MPKFLDRRRFLLLSAAAAASTRAFAQAAPTAITVTLHPDQPGPTVPANFIGLSYETQQLSDPTFFSPANTGLITQFRTLAPHGVLRLGGNTSDYGFWKPTPSSMPPPRAKREYKVGDPTPDLSYAVTPESVRNLDAFLRATGWTCLYGINLGTNTPALAAAEAAFVARTLGPRLEYFQIGNEADRFGSTIRDPKTWSVDAFLAEWLTFANAIKAAVPGAPFGMPDIASDARWFATIAERLAAMHESCAQYCTIGRACGCADNPSDPKVRPNIACLTHHYYIGGPPSSPDMTVARILQPDPHVRAVASTVSAAAAKLDTKWRMTEGNTCYRGGKPGVSDVFAAALWAADYALLLATLGYAGINLHGGDGQMVANSLGGKLPGEALMPDPTVPHPRPFYTPIAHIGSDYVFEPVAYGLLFAGQFAGAVMLPVDFNPGPANATAYAGRLPSGQILLAIINKDATQPLHIDVPGYSLARTLTAAGLDSRRVHFDEPNTNREASIVAPGSAVLLQSARA